jgi:hypothetical protein
VWLAVKLAGYDLAPPRLPPDPLCLLPFEVLLRAPLPELLLALADWRLPWLMLPARRASSEVNSCAVPFW